MDTSAPIHSYSEEAAELPIDTERVLSTQQAQNVLAIADELASIRIKPNDYYEDPESRQFLDDVTNGLLNTMLAYCESFGWKRLSKQLRNLIPLQGNQMESLSLIRDFIAPQVRSLVVLKDLVPSPNSASVLRTQEANDVLPAWPAIRACLQEFRFYDIKELVGLGGIDVTSLAHLEQDAQGGVPKGRLMTAVDRLYGGMSATIQTRFLTTLIEEILRRKPESQEKLDEYLVRLGWTFLGQRLVPLGVLRPETLDDTPEVCRSDLLKAAQRLRDGDMTGAISAACGAVDSATSQVYVELGLGDPTAASFQERCKRAVQARGVLAALDEQLQGLGWEQAEIVSLHRNLEGALKQGAYVMQTLRSHMGDVHGSKPILRPLVFDCLRWAELIVALLVALTDRQ